MRQSPRKRLATATPAFCAVCRRRAGPLGYSRRGEDPLWVCHDDDCRNNLHKVREMPQPEFDALESEAIGEAGALAGAYLDSIGKSDLAKLSEAEWREFLERVVDGFGSHLRHRLVAPHVPA